MWRGTARDHPRSRGVYTPSAPPGCRWPGSSPLARGLLLDSIPYGLQAGIIPARAGFTRRSVSRWSGQWDHPRSRGVYRNNIWNNPLAIGSSPLARGLPLPVRLGTGLHGIIPARAGFTPPRSPRPRPGRDHPRSRGVYPVKSRVAGDGPGSSPLARGLPLLLIGPMRWPRIIPARAGFTEAHHSRRLSRPDHPRSRGVYGPSSAPARWSEGSSPLARGLRHGVGMGGVGDRIIPARAGFTPTANNKISFFKDHPRSRGVYAATPRMAARMVGSSPLARGLLISP